MTDLPPALRREIERLMAEVSREFNTGEGDVDSAVAALCAKVRRLMMLSAREMLGTTTPPDVAVRALLNEADDD